jgi:hypothetical protein
MRTIDFAPARKLDDQGDFRHTHFKSPAAKSSTTAIASSSNAMASALGYSRATATTGAIGFR